MIPNKNELIFVDCGAPSLYNKLSRISGKGEMGSSFAKRKFDDYSYTESEAYLEYRDKYIEYIKAHKKKLSIYSNLDVINNPKLTLKNQKYLEKKGINPIPVFHLGTDVKYLEKYLEKYEYIAIGGLVPNPTSVLIPILDKLFKEVLCDEKGYPKAKYHGFACTSVTLMLRYPWYSVDSATSVKLGGFGKVFLPPVRGAQKLHIRRLSEKGNDAGMEEGMTLDCVSHLNTSNSKPLPKLSARILTAELLKIDLTLAQLKEDGGLRAYWNQLMMERMLLEHSPKWPWSFTTRKSKGDDFIKLYRAGSYNKKLDTVYKEQKELGHSVHNHRLCSFFYPNDLLKYYSLYNSTEDENKKEDKSGKKRNGKRSKKNKNN